MAPRASLVLGVSSILLLGACGDDGDSSDTASSRTSKSVAPRSCDNVMVPGHQAVMVRAAGIGCDVAEKVAAAAEGRGRAAYQSKGLSCTPRDAEGGDTTYTCASGAAKVTFLYGTS